MHFWSLPNAGDRASAFVPVEFSVPYDRTLIGSSEYDVRTVKCTLCCNPFTVRTELQLLLCLLQPAARQGFFTHNFPMLNYEMFLVNSKITEPHNWDSRYYQWVRNARGVAYWGGEFNEDGVEGRTRAYLLYH